MHPLYLITVLAVAWSASLVRADLAANVTVRQVNDVLDAKPPLTLVTPIPTYVRKAEAALESKSKSWVINGDTIKLLEQFIEVGKSILAEDCSERSLHLIESFPTKQKENGLYNFSSWNTAMNEYNYEYNRVCSAKLRAAEKQLHASLDKNEVRKVERFVKIAAPIIEQDDGHYMSHIAKAIAIRFDAIYKSLFASAEFNKELLEYRQRKSDVKNPLAEVFDRYVVEPCRYYTGSTSVIFVQQINRYKDFGLDDEEYLGHFFGYELCSFFLHKLSP